MAHKIGRIRRPAQLLSSTVLARRSIKAGALQAKLRVGPQNDAYEREADRVAEQVMNAPEGAAQRACTACAEEEKARRAPMGAPEEESLQRSAALPEAQRQVSAEKEEEMQAKPMTEGLQRASHDEEEEIQTAPLPSLHRVPGGEEEEMHAFRAPDQRADLAAERGPHATRKRDGSFELGPALSAQVSGLKSGGAPLSASARAFFEPRFGADFSDVKVHTGPQAQRAAKALGARAFTSGRDVVFGRGEFAPHSHRGGRLMAHELTHVLQQRGGARTKTQGPVSSAPPNPASLQRWSLGGTPVPAGANWQEVPDGTGGGVDHRTRLGEAHSIVSNLLSSTRCQNYFRDHCENGTQSSLRDAFNAARVYHIAAGGNLFGQNQLGTGNIAYNRKAYQQGKWFLAATLLHELFHVCAPTMSEHARELKAENAVERCRLYAPFLDRLSVRQGAVGTQVTLTGWGLGPTQGSTDRVMLGGVTCPVVSWSFNRSSSAVSITVTVPQGAVSGMIRVINNGVRSNARRFTVI